MQIHEINPKIKIKKEKRTGRGGKRGTYSGRGVKGQKARAGRKMPPIIRELIKRYPKLRGYQFSPLSRCFGINISVLDKVFESGEEVTPKTLIRKGVLPKGKKYTVKILGKGETNKKLHVKGCLVSKSAKERIEKVGGKITGKKQEESRKSKKSESK